MLEGMHATNTTMIALMVPTRHSQQAAISNSSCLGSAPRSGAPPVLANRNAPEETASIRDNVRFWDRNKRPTIQLAGVADADLNIQFISMSLFLTDATEHSRAATDQSPAEGLSFNQECERSKNTLLCS